MTTKKGNIVGLALDNWLEYLGPWLTNTEAYNSFFFGKNSSVYQERARTNGWYESQIFKD
ncbi:hypothetical protein [Flavobacterium sp. CLA17]|uniref:hypothetical protein n=1 Tax=Flavobacterium sp. CLA17 TaxID=2724135 RepID=UPI0014931677|nr:hypothetical protein [Flavobacterium sp. CLA17]QSB26285.1 hypothetical protein HAV12_018150 [Flavobacterium sp. CLA17]